MSIKGSSMIKQQITGVVILSTPLIILFTFWPALLCNTVSQIICSLLLGLYIYYSNWFQLKNLERMLQYVPTGAHAAYFDAIIQQCGVPRDTVVLKYAFTNEMIAMAAGKTVIVDPTLWHGLHDDPESVKVMTVFQSHIKPTLNSIVQERMHQVHLALTSEAQAFIFKHELGHIVRHYSWMKLIVIFVMGTVATYCGILAAAWAYQISGLLALILGLFVGGMTDFLLSFLLNITFKLHEEKQADWFAVQYSSPEEVHAAAEFFIQHQIIFDQYKATHNFLETLPSEIRTGHQKGTVRSAYLLKLLDAKNK